MSDESLEIRQAQGREVVYQQRDDEFEHVLRLLRETLPLALKVIASEDLKTQSEFWESFTHLNDFYDSSPLSWMLEDGDGLLYALWDMSESPNGRGIVGYLTDVIEFHVEARVLRNKSA
jgi:hypothetical protein